ncbi:DUF397 domain-containing protein [Nocardiopsis suaedae]|uniref:DUF397 domain-containing protein n=1 Tax=Nocardiopsis suaedae TaxID=3018444 RepID=A0ABT4TUU8_9ACTN|nr:DUF397 domain-containing protein [Nocardiopsis suaedae]MDA2807980.1 DUF397 domain-containing protein [Nocardiopsis suaedae]
MDWHKSTYSGQGAGCVEVSEGPTTLVRDTMNRSLGHLGFSASEWRAFIAATADDEL